MIQKLIPSIHNWQQFISLSFAHGIFPIVYSTLKKQIQNIPTSILTIMKTHNIEIAKKNMLMTTELIKLMKLFEENSIDAIAFKGPTLSQMAYGDITLRQYADLDILIDEKDLQKSINLLSSTSYTIDEVEYQNIMKNQSIFHDISLYKYDINFELHWRLLSDEFKTDIDHINIKENLHEVVISNYKFKSFENEILILYLAIHGAKHNWERVEWLLDIVKIIQNHTIDWQRIIELMKKTKTEKILLSSLSLCRNVLDLSLPIKVENLINKPKILKISEELEKYFYTHFHSGINQNVATKKISKTQYNLLSGYKNKFLFILSLLKPTEIDFKTIQLPHTIRFVYYIIRPFNVLFRWAKKL